MNLNITSPTTDFIRHGNCISGTLIWADMVCDHIPLVCTVTNIINLIAKTIFGLISCVWSGINRWTYVHYLNEKKNVCICLTLIISGIFFANRSAAHSLHADTNQSPTPPAPAVYVQAQPRHQQQQPRHSAPPQPAYSTTSLSSLGVIDENFIRGMIAETFRKINKDTIKTHMEPFLNAIHTLRTHAFDKHIKFLRAYGKDCKGHLDYIRYAAFKASAILVTLVPFLQRSAVAMGLQLFQILKNGYPQHENKLINLFQEHWVLNEIENNLYALASTHLGTSLVDIYSLIKSGTGKKLELVVIRSKQDFINLIQNLQSLLDQPDETSDMFLSNISHEPENTARLLNDFVNSFTSDIDQPRTYQEAGPAFRELYNQYKGIGGSKEIKSNLFDVTTQADYRKLKRQMVLTLAVDKNLELNKEALSPIYANVLKVCQSVEKYSGNQTSHASSSSS